MKVIILAGGIGKRYNMGLIEKENIPKCLLPVKSNYSILRMNLKNILRQKEISKVLIVTGFKKNLIEDHLETWFYGQGNIQTIYNPEYNKSVIFSVKRDLKV